jgi:hypothetical protein
MARRLRDATLPEAWTADRSNLYAYFGRGRCPLWVKTRHLQCTNPCPLYPQERTFAVQKQMSALGHSGHQSKCAVHNRKRNRIRGPSAAPLCNCRRPPGEPILSLYTTPVIYLTLDRLRRRAAAVMYVPSKLKSSASVAIQSLFCSFVWTDSMKAESIFFHSNALGRRREGHR